MHDYKPSPVIDIFCGCRKRFQVGFFKFYMPNKNTSGMLYGWLVVWNMNFIFPNSWDDDPIWLSYFSGGLKLLKPPTRWHSGSILLDQSWMVSLLRSRTPWIAFARLWRKRDASRLAATGATGLPQAPFSMKLLDIKVKLCYHTSPKEAIDWELIMKYDGEIIHLSTSHVVNPMKNVYPICAFLHWWFWDIIKRNLWW